MAKQSYAEKLSYNAGYFEAHKQEIYAQRKQRKNTTVRGRLYALCSNANLRSYKMGWDFNLTTDFLEGLWNKQNGMCAISGVPMELSSGTGKRFGNNVASIDRINSSLGYTTDNVWLVGSRVNYAKGVLSLEDFISMCSKIVEYNK